MGDIINHFCDPDVGEGHETDERDADKYAQLCLKAHASKLFFHSSGSPGLSGKNSLAYRVSIAGRFHRVKAKTFWLDRSVCRR